jgi:hypothetical protein
LLIRQGGARRLPGHFHSAPGNTTMRISAALTLSATVALIACADATPAYVGTWKVNLAESDFGQLTLIYEPVEGGGFKATMDGQSYTFKMDGSEVPTPWGISVAWNSIDSTAWQQIAKVNGKLLSTDTIRLSADHMMLTIASQMMQATGATSSDTMSFTRKAGERGLAGTWQAQRMNSSSAGTLEIALEGSDGLAFTFVEMQGECHARFDGADYPATGPMWASGWTCAISKNGDNALDISVKKDGTPMYVSTYTPSADGMKLTEVGGSANTAEKVTVVYDRQQ